MASINRKVTIAVMAVLALLLSASAVPDLGLVRISQASGYTVTASGNPNPTANASSGVYVKIQASRILLSAQWGVYFGDSSPNSMVTISGSGSYKVFAHTFPACGSYNVTGWAKEPGGANVSSNFIEHVCDSTNTDNDPSATYGYDPTGGSPAGSSPSPSTGVGMTQAAALSLINTARTNALSMLTNLVNRQSLVYGYTLQSEYFSVPLIAWDSQHSVWLDTGEDYPITFVDQYGYTHSFTSDADIETGTIWQDKYSSVSYNETFLPNPKTDNYAYVAVFVNVNVQMPATPGGYYAVSVKNEGCLDGCGTQTYSLAISIDSWTGQVTFTQNTPIGYSYTWNTVTAQMLQSLRYTVRHGGQMAVDTWASGGNTTLANNFQYTNENICGTGCGFTNEYDIYAPIAQPYLSSTYDSVNSYPDSYLWTYGSSSSDNIYADCILNQGKDHTNYPYESRVCSITESVYITTISNNDPLAASLWALHELELHGSPTTSYCAQYEDSSNTWHFLSVLGSVCWSPAALANYIANNYLATDSNGNVLGINTCVKYGISGISIYCQPSVASGVRTAAFGALETVLGYAYGNSTSKYLANEMASAVLAEQIASTGNETGVYKDGGV